MGAAVIPSGYDAVEDVGECSLCQGDIHMHTLQERVEGVVFYDAWGARQYRTDHLLHRQAILKRKFVCENGHTVFVPEDGA